LGTLPSHHGKPLGRPALQFVETIVGKFALEVRGQTNGFKPWVVLWPSVFSDRHLYDLLVPLLEPHYALVLFDPPGHGQSEVSNSAMTLAATAEASLKVLDSLSIEEAYWVGTSWGGMIGVHAVLQAPHRIKHLACLNTPFDLPAKADLGTKLIVAGARWIGKTSIFANGVARSFFRPETLLSNPEFAARHRAVFLNADRQALHKVARHVLVRRENVTPLLSSLNVPTLVIAGRQDMYPVSSMAAAAALIDGATFQIIEDSRHISAADAPQAIYSALHSAWAKLS
jgi:3-oxoadipate enol-lactonase